MMNQEEQETMRLAVRASCTRAGGLCFLLTIYGVFRVFVSGIAFDHKLYTYVPIALGLVGSFGATYYQMFAFSRESGSSKSRTMAGMMPYIAGMYMTGFLGIYGLYTLTREFATLPLLRSILFIVFGYKCVFHLWVATEVEKKSTEPAG